MSVVKGEDWVVHIFHGGLWKPFVCARSGNLSINTGIIETTVTGSGDWKSFEPTVHDYSASIDGVVSLSVSGSLTLADLQALQIAKTKILCRFFMTDVDANYYQREAYFFITNSTDTGSFDGIATFSIQLIGTGGITTVFTPPSPNNGEVFRYPEMGDTAPVAAGTLSITVSNLGGKNILHVSVDGRGNNDIILSGTPVNQEVLYETDGTDGIFTWPYAFEEGTNWYVLYQNL